MTDIGSLLRSPVWWFGAVFVALIISVIAAFLKEGLSRLLSQLIRQISVSREKRRQEDEGYVTFLSHQPDLLSVEMQMCNLGFQRILMVFLVLLMLPVTLLFKHAFPGTGLFRLEIVELAAPSVTNWTDSVGLLLCLVLMLTYHGWYRLLRRAYREQRSRRANENTGGDVQ